jgi:hypothetical protein
VIDRKPAFALCGYCRNVKGGPYVFLCPVSPVSTGWNSRTPSQRTERCAHLPLSPARRFADKSTAEDLVHEALHPHVQWTRASATNAIERPLERAKQQIKSPLVPIFLHLIVLDKDQGLGRSLRERSAAEIGLLPRGGNMPEERKSIARRSGSTIEISELVRAHGITRDQARRLISRTGKNRAKLDQTARILKARFPSPRPTLGTLDGKVEAR